MPGGEIVPAGERGVIECGEWVGPAEDMKIGFQTVWKYFYMPSTHEPATVLELLINGDVWKASSPDLQEIIRSATWEATFRSQTIINKLNAEALKELREKHGVKIERTPEDILRKTLEAWDQIAKDEADKNPFFKKVYESQRAYASQGRAGAPRRYPALRGRRRLLLAREEVIEMRQGPRRPRPLLFVARSTMGPHAKPACKRARASAVGRYLRHHPRHRRHHDVDRLSVRAAASSR